MSSQALGLIEIYGYTASLEAADASLKSANVELIGLEKVQGGLVTIKLEGDVSAVKTAVDAGVMAAGILGTVISHTVIARPGQGLEKIVNPKSNKDEKKDQPEDQSDDKEDKTEHKENPKLKNNENQDIKNEEASDKVIASLEPIKVDFQGEKINIADQKELEKLKVVKLRKIGRSLEGIGLDNSKIKYARKNELVEAILSYAKTEEVNV